MIEQVTIDLPIQFSSFCIVYKATLLPDIAPHLAWENTFALCYAEGKWRVTHVETGYLVEKNRSSVLAIESARAELRRQTLASMAAAVKKSRCGTGEI